MTPRARYASRPRHIEALIQSSAVGIYELDANRQPVYASPRFCELVGLPLDAVLRGEWVTVLTADDRAALERERARAAEIDGRVRFETRIVRPNGEEAWVLAQSQPFYDDADALLGYTGTLTDITETRRAQEILRRSEARLNEAQRIAQVGSWSEDLATRAITWSNEVYRILELDPNTVQPSPEAFFARVPEPESSALRAAFARALVSRQPFELVHRIIVPRGAVKHVREHVEIEFDADGTPRHVLGTAQDITATVRAEDELRIHSRVLLSMSEGVLFCDQAGLIRFANPAFEAMFGYGHGELLGQPVTVLNDDDDAGNAKIVETVMSAVLTRGSYDAEFQNRRKDGSVFPSRARIMRLDLESETLFVTIQQDITEERRVAEAQHRALVEKETLLREIHHRVKNNLQLISGLLHFQSKKVRDQEDLAAFVDGQHRLQAMILVHEHLYRSADLSRIRLHEYARALVDALASSIDTGERVAIATAAAPVELPIEQALPCGMILCELVTNAFKHAFPEERRGHIEIEIARSGERVRLGVRDDGVGLPEPFDTAGARSFGWRLVRNLVKQLEGTLELEEAVGTRVVVTFPAAPGPSRRSDESPLEREGPT